MDDISAFCDRLKKVTPGKDESFVLGCVPPACFIRVEVACNGEHLHTSAFVVGDRVRERLEGAWVKVRNINNKVSKVYCSFVKAYDSRVSGNMKIMKTNNELLKKFRAIDHEAYVQNFSDLQLTITTPKVPSFDVDINDIEKSLCEFMEQVASSSESENSSDIRKGFELTKRLETYFGNTTFIAYGGYGDEAMVAVPFFRDDICVNVNDEKVLTEIKEMLTANEAYFNPNVTIEILNILPLPIAEEISPHFTFSPLKDTVLINRKLF